MKTLYEKRVKELEAMQQDFEQVRVLTRSCPRLSLQQTEALTATDCNRRPCGPSRHHHAALTWVFRSE